MAKITKKILKKSFLYKSTHAEEEEKEGEIKLLYMHLIIGITRISK